MNEPGIRIDVTDRSPLTSETAFVLEPLTLPVNAMTTKAFHDALTKILGDGLHVQPRYSQRDLAKVAQEYAAKGQQLTQKALAGIRTIGVKVDPAGELKREGRIVPINMIEIGDMGCGVNVCGTSDDCYHVFLKVIEALDEVSGNKHGWEWYEARIARRRNGTTSVSQLGATLIDLLSERVRNLLKDVVEQQLAQQMLGGRKHGVPKLAFAKVMVHELDLWVSVAEEGGTTNQYRLELSHASDEDVSDRTIHVLSELDYDSHMKLVDELRKVVEDDSAS